MKIPSTNGNLLILDNAYEQLYSTPIGLLLKGKIDAFYQNNAVRINSIKEKRNDLNREFWDYDENGNPIIDEVEGKKQVRLKEEIRRREYNEKLKELMQTEISIEL